MRTVGIIQARLGSSRLPGKVLQDLAGDTMLARVVARVRAAHSIDEVVIATTTAPFDDAIVAEAERLDAPVWRGSEDDVLERYLGAARRVGAEVIVRVTSDCPLLDPTVLDCVVSALHGEPPVDYASNTHVRSYPRGLDVEAMFRDTLERCGRMGKSKAAREHVTAFVMERPELFDVRQVRSDRDDSDLRWTVDTHEDLAVVRAIYAACGLGNRIAPYDELVAAVRANPAITNLNAHVRQKPTFSMIPELGHV